MKRIVGVEYENGVCTGVTVDGILDNVTEPDYEVKFERVKHGHWTYQHNENLGVFMKDLMICSVCGCAFTEIPRKSYCGNCGAKMDEVEND